MYIRIYPVLVFLLSVLLTSCGKSTTEPATATITIMEYGNPVDINNDTIYLASDYNFFGKAMVESSDLTKVRYIVSYDDKEITSTTYTPQPGGTGFLVDSIIFHIDYASMAPAFNHVTLQVEATQNDGQVTRGHVTFKLQPVNYPFQFRFFDFNFNDTLAAGTSLTMRPFYSPLTVDDQISVMRVYRKEGFNAESLVETFVASDFFYYQTGYLREFDYQVPALPTGSGIVHRFELVTTKGRTHVIQHTTKVE